MFRHCDIFGVFSLLRHQEGYQLCIVSLSRLYSNQRRDLALSSTYRHQRSLRGSPAPLAILNYATLSNAHRIHKSALWLVNYRLSQPAITKIIQIFRNRIVCYSRFSIVWFYSAENCIDFLPMNTNFYELKRWTKSYSMIKTTMWILPDKIGRRRYISSLWRIFDFSKTKETKLFTDDRQCNINFRAEQHLIMFFFYSYSVLDGIYNKLVLEFFFTVVSITVWLHLRTNGFVQGNKNTMCLYIKYFISYIINLYSLHNRIIEWAKSLFSYSDICW